MKSPITEIHEQLVAGTITPKNLLEDSLNAISSKDSDIHAFIEVFKDASVQEKISSTDSLIAGIPVGIKDNMLIQGKEATACSSILKGHIAPYDAFVIKELKRQGAVIVGRLNMDDSAMGSSTETSCYGPTRNPIDLSRVPGGSSGGPAAAVAAKMVPYTLGSDTGGSVRQPAALCGIVGYKPTYGTVSRNGLIAMASSLDVIGPLTQTVADARIVYNAINGYDELDATSVPFGVRDEYQSKISPNRKIIGVPRKFLQQEGIDQEVLDAFEAGLDKMRENGYTIVDIDIPFIELSLAVYYIIQPAEASSNLARYDGIRYGFSKRGENLLDLYTQTKGEGFGKEVQRRIMLGTYVLSSGYHDEYYYKAQALRQEISRHIYEIFNQVDVIATPTAPSVAFPLGSKMDPVSMYLQDIFTVPYNLSGNPAISIPAGTNHEGLPIGMHFAGPRFGDSKLLDISEDFERAIL
jgi:aspartyl-tRNA(Asn)/glutamyl-tRNA(Gln) amidotransferase subunit A